MANDPLKQRYVVGFRAHHVRLNCQLPSEPGASERLDRAGVYGLRIRLANNGTRGVLLQQAGNPRPGPKFEYKIR